MIGVVGFGAYIPRLRLQRRTIAEANAWYVPGMAGKARGAKAMANWDEDSITMAVGAARDCLGPAEDRSHVTTVFLASTTLPYAERLNAAVVCEALTLESTTEALEFSGSQRAGLSALTQAAARVRGAGGTVLVLAADARQVQARRARRRLDYGDGAAAVLVGTQGVIAEHLGIRHPDHRFRRPLPQRPAKDIDYAWEERWVRDEGYGKLMPRRRLRAALAKAGVAASDVAHFVMPSTSFRGARCRQIASRHAASAPRAGWPTPLLEPDRRHRGRAIALLMLAHVLEQALRPAP